MISYAWLTAVQVKKKGDHMNLDLHLTTACNMKCSFCGAWEYGREHAYITLADAENALDAGRKSGYRITTLTGGEPAIHPEYCTILETAHEKGYWTVVTTNGLYLDEEIINTYRRCRTLVRISLHTLDEKLHERLTGTDSLPKILDNINKLRKAGVRLGIGCTVTEENRGEMENLAGFAWDSGAEFIRYTPVVGIRGAAGQRMDRDFFREILRTIALMTITNSGSMEKEDRDISFLRGIMELMLTRKCAGGSRQHIIYDCHGTVVPCSFLPEDMGLCCRREGQAAGDKADPAAEIQERIRTVRGNMDMFLASDRADSLQGQCNTCRFRKSCMGGCLTMKLPLDLEVTDEQPVCLLQLMKELEDEFSEDEQRILYGCWAGSFLRKSGAHDKERTCMRRLPIWELNFRRGQMRGEKSWNSI